MLVLCTESWFLAAKPKNTALTNHKRWLKSLQMLKKELAEEEEVQRQEEQEKRNKVHSS